MGTFTNEGTMVAEDELTQLLDAVPNTIGVRRALNIVRELPAGGPQTPNFRFHNNDVDKDLTGLVRVADGGDGSSQLKFTTEDFDDGNNYDPASGLLKLPLAPGNQEPFIYDFEFNAAWAFLVAGTPTAATEDARWALRIQGKEIFDWFAGGQVGERPVVGFRSRGFAKRQRIGETEASFTGRSFTINTGNFDAAPGATTMDIIFESVLQSGSGNAGDPTLLGDLAITFVEGEQLVE